MVSAVVLGNTDIGKAKVRDLVELNHYMPRVYEVNMPCQWLENCYGGKCQALVHKSGNLYCAKKISH